MNVKDKIVVITGSSKGLGFGLAKAFSDKGASVVVSGRNQDDLRRITEGTNIRVLAVYPGGMQTHLFDENKPADFDRFMTADSVAGKIVDNIALDEPVDELIIRRPPA